MQEQRLQNLLSDEIYDLTQPTVIIGRADSCDVHLDSELLSRQHAALLVSEDKVIIKDLGSTNGTFVNKVRIFNPIELNPGDVISFGDQKLSLLEPIRDNSAPEDEKLYADELVEYRALDNTSNKTMIRSSFKPSDDWPFPMPAAEPLPEPDDLISKALASRKIDPQRVPAVLIVKSGRNKGGVYELKLPVGVERYWALGRSALSDVVLSDPTVSNTHAYIQWENGSWYVSDNNSTNGVKLNSVHVKQSRCKSGDVISMGNIELLFHVL